MIYIYLLKDTSDWHYTYSSYLYDIIIIIIIPQYFLGIENIYHLRRGLLVNENRYVLDLGNMKIGCDVNKKTANIILMGNH